MLGPFPVVKPALTLRPKAAAPRGADRAGPIAWWKLDEASGSQAASAAGTNFTGQVRGQPRWAPDQGRHQGALELDGLSNWMECADTADCNLGESLTAAVWFKARADRQGGDTLLAKGGAWQLLHRVASAPEVELTLSGPQVTGTKKTVAPRVVCPAPPADGQWHHLAGTYDGKRIVLYLDGMERGATLASGPLAWNNLPVTLGDNAGSPGRRWSGWLDDARLYGHALGADDVKTLYRENAK